jgi:hypothetical protein
MRKATLPGEITNWKTFGIKSSTQAIHGPGENTEHLHVLL